MREVDLKVLDSLDTIAAQEWDALTDNNPTLRHAFLQSMVDAGCTTAKTGWLPQFLTLWRDVDGRQSLCGAVPLYVKSHSYGEYVFDWSWAEAYQRHGLAYYPKLLSAIPFTPCSGGRLLAKTSADRKILVDGLISLAEQSDVSSLHVLFPDAEDHQLLVAKGMMPRTSIQFHWQNAGYKSFADFLATMSHDKRKKVKQERRKVVEAGITFKRLVGSDITDADWDFFVECYDHTYRAHFSTPYLNRKFFGLIGKRMPENVLLIVAEREGKRIASALNLFSEDTLYGRYWGGLEFHSGLHFETCYYQALEFCIARGIQVFEGGAQGEHKLARGFLPVKCHSAHWLKQPQFAKAVEDFLRRESGGMAQYVNELGESSPFKSA
ncbi:MAG: GNAT family N-acetyltransferase [Burkholderiales bacterium]|nr:GNAT family N-acetyltransferase [Burkholderiales bacterium]